MIPLKDRLTWDQAWMWSKFQKATKYLEDPRYKEVQDSFRKRTGHRGLFSTDLILVAKEVLNEKK